MVDNHTFVVYGQDGTKHAGRRDFELSSQNFNETLCIEALFKLRLKLFLSYM